MDFGTLLLQERVFMTIRLDKKNRLRLSKEDVLTLKKNKSIICHFNITKDIRLTVELVIQESLSQSYLVSSQDSICFYLADKDFFRIQSESKFNKQSTLDVDNYSIEVDFWNKEYRKRVETVHGT